MVRLAAMFFKFQSTRPYGARPRGYTALRGCKVVSIHAPRMERDDRVPTPSDRNGCFNPRAPYGARHITDYIIFHQCHVSIHAPRMERDNK